MCPAQVGLAADVASGATHRLGVPAEVHHRAEQHPVLLPGQEAVPGRCGAQSDSEVPARPHWRREVLRLEQGLQLHSQWRAGPQPHAVEPLPAAGHGHSQGSAPVAACLLAHAIRSSH